MANFLGGAMRALSRSPKTAKFVDTLNHADLPRGWSDDPEIMRMAGDAWEELGTDSPFFRSFYRNSKLVDPEGYPVVFYHGSQTEGLDAIDPDMSRLVPKGGAAFGAASLAGAAGGLLADAAMGLAPDLPEVPDEYYETAQ